MSEAQSAVPFSNWRSPECPFLIEYSAHVVDEIRLAIVDAFCSVPRGGVEIGGVLLGTWQSERVLISAYAPLDCEHRHGPSFTLSTADEERLAALLTTSVAENPGLVAVGWYHSHTRSEIFLSEADVAIHERFFPESWQVALVLKPRMMQPTRAAFFFRDVEGKMRTTPCEEFAIDSETDRAASGATVLEMPSPDARARLQRGDRTPASGHGTEPVPLMLPLLPVEIAEEPVPVEEAVETAPPAPPPFLAVEELPSRGWITSALILLGLSFGGAAAYVTHEAWLPKVTAAMKPVAGMSGFAAPLHFNAIEKEGQLQISWDPTAAPVRSAVDAALEITDGSQLPHAIALDQAHLQNGFVTYGRQSERVDMKLVLHQPDGTQVREVTTYLGPLPDSRPLPDDPALRRERDELAKKAGRLQSDLDKQAERTRKLERDLKSIRNEMRQQQKRRMTNMVPDGK